MLCKDRKVTRVVVLISVLVKRMAGGRGDGEGKGKGEGRWGGIMPYGVWFGGTLIGFLPSASLVISLPYSSPQSLYPSSLIVYSPSLGVTAFSMVTFHPMGTITNRFQLSPQSLLLYSIVNIHTEIFYEPMILRDILKEFARIFHLIFDW